jgi:carbon-monoxide dehydrogenase catalytic subunit
METIHLKTVDPVSQELLRSAAQRGIELPWERYEKLQPQDGFLRLGLSCPFGCMQGPCRIDPFGRGAQKGICGLGPDEMAAGMLLRLCLQGAMDALGSAAASDGVPEVQFSATLGKMVSLVLSENGQADLSADDILKASTMLGRSSFTCQELIAQAFRLSLLTLGFLEQDDEKISSGSKKCTAGYGTMAVPSVRIGFSGPPSPGLVQGLERESKKDPDAPVVLVSLGDWIPLKDEFMPMACTSGESELLLSSGAIHLLVAGTGTDPGLIDLCEQLNIPVVCGEDIVEPENIVRRARKVYSTLSQASLFADTSSAAEGQVLLSSGDMAQTVVGEGKVALIGGADSLQMSLGQLPVELATALCDQGLQVAGWGDAALWMIKNGLMSGEKKKPLLALENSLGPLLAIKGLAETGQLDRLQGICFTGLKGCRDLAMSLGLAYLGCRVTVASPIPIQGSQTVSDTMAEIVQANGGRLDHYDHIAQTKEIVEWFKDS